MNKIIRTFVILLRSMSVSVISSQPYTLGEGPHWDQTSQSLLFVDIINGNIHRWNSLTNEETKIHIGGNVSFVIPRRSGGYIANRDRHFIHVTEVPYSVALIGDEQDLGTKNVINDAKCDAAGRVWSGTMGHETAPLEFEKGIASLYSLDTDLSIKRHLDKLDLSNGLAWTADNKTMYFVDTLPRKVYAFDFDLSHGSISNQRVAIDLSSGTVEELGYPDGMVIDTNDKLWVACYAAGKVIQFDPQTGKQLRAVALPVKEVTSCCFGGQNYDELYVTSLRHNSTDDELKASPLSGYNFKVTGLGAKGTAPYIFEG